jgi:serine protease AprX
VQASVHAQDPENDQVKLTYVWTIDGVVKRTVQNTSSQNDTFSWSGASAGQVISLTVTPNDGTMDGAPVTASGTVVESAPTVSVILSGVLPHGQAQANIQMADADNDQVKVNYVWKVNGQVVRTQANTNSGSDQLPLNSYHYGDLISVEVTPTDGFLTGATVVKSATLNDNAPTAKVDLKFQSTVSGAGQGVRPTGSASANVQTTDPEGDPVTVTYVWTVDGTVKRTVTHTNAMTDTFSWSGLSAGQVVSVSVTPNDGTMNGAAVTGSGTVAESAPSTAVTVEGQLNPQGTITAHANSTDRDGDVVSMTYVWTVNGTTVRTLKATSNNTDTLSLAPYHYGDVVMVSVTATDGWLTGTAATASATLVDHAPMASVNLQPVNLAGYSHAAWRPNGSAVAQVNAQDPDHDPTITLTYVWKVNNTVKQTDTTTSQTDTFSWSGAANQSTISVTVTPSDGTMSGQPANASSPIAEQVPAASVQLGGDIRAGGLAQAHVTTSDGDNDPISLTYVWSVNGAIEQVDTNVTQVDDRFALPTSLSPGATVTVRATPNDSFFNGAVSSSSATSSGISAQALNSGAGYDPSQDPYSMYDTTLFTGAQAWWSAGYTGKGVTVAVIDTGVTPVPALGGGDKITYGPDLSLDSQNPNLADIDSNGHGTFMAGLIAGRDQSPAQPGSAAASVYRGMAPDAKILSVKVGATDGEVDVTQVIAAIDWIVQHRNDHGMNVRVISLSYGTNSTQPYAVDPLAYAAEQAWKAGIVVVAAAGNTGFQQGAGAPGVADPASDPFVIAAGGVDSMGTYANSDDRLGDYSATSAGCPAPACKGPDLLAYGSHVQGLRVPGSFIDLNHPEGRLGDLYFRGSGTSESTALTAGAIALILQHYPDMSPDDVKAFIESGADKLPGFDSSVQGAGELDLFNLLSTQPPSGTSQGFAASTGTGTIEGSRGSDHLVANGVTLQGEKDIFGAPVSTSTLATAEAAGNTWSGGTWNGNTWSGNTWSGNTWSGNTWSGNTWSGNTWSGNTWSGNTWSGNTWSGNTWSGNTWSGNTWSGNTWSGNTWSGNSWS